MGMKKSELKLLQNTASNMITILSLQTKEIGTLSTLATKLTERAKNSTNADTILMAENMNDVMIELSTSLGIIGSALQKALKIK
tara:strand:- start:233 stop:484 length:252 start_codon:yes stop_codon:yes gene_type:complete